MVNVACIAFYQFGSVVTVTGIEKYRKGVSILSCSLSKTPFQ